MQLQTALCHSYNYITFIAIFKLFCIFFFYMALLTWDILHKTYGDFFFPWCVLCNSTANEHSLLIRKHFSHALTTCSVCDTTHNWATTSCSSTDKRMKVFADLPWLSELLPLCSRAQLGGYFVVTICLTQFDTILLWAMKPRNHLNLHIFIDS